MPRFFSFFRGFLRLEARIPESGAKRPGAGSVTVQNGRNKSGRRRSLEEWTVHHRPRHNLAVHLQPQRRRPVGTHQLCPTPLSHRCFSPVSPPDFAHFPPFFARSLRLGARKPDSAKERRKNGGKRAQNGRETVGWVALGYRVGAGGTPSAGFGAGAGAEPGAGVAEAHSSNPPYAASNSLWV